MGFCEDLNSILTPLSWSAAEVKWSPCSQHPSPLLRDSWGLGRCYGYRSFCCIAVPQTAHLRQKQSTTQTRNADLQIRKLPDGLISCRLPPSLLPSISLYPPLFALLMAFGCNCTCFVFTRLQLLIAHKLKQSHKKWKVIFGTLKVNSIHSRHPSSLQFILLSLTEHSIADGSFPIDSEATDQENYFKQFSPVPSPQHWPL